MSNKTNMPAETQTDLIADAAAEQAKPTRNKYADKMNKQRKKLPKQVQIAIWIVVILALVIGGIFAVKKAQEASTATLEGETTTFSMRGMLETYVEGNGRTAAKNRTELGKDLKGEVTDVFVQVGDTVHEGDILFIVDAKDTRKDLDEARSEMTDAMRAVDDAAASLRTAQKNVTNLSITAPFSGKLIPAKADETPTYRIGQNLAEGTVLGLMVDDSVMHLPLYFNYTYIDELQVGAAAQVSIPASMSSVTGKVDSIERVQKVSDDGVVLFRAVISLPNPGTLKKDMMATASVSTANGTIMPAESGKLEYIREEEVTVKSGGEITQIGNLDYYNYTAGAVICRLRNEDTQSAVESAQRALEGQQKALTTKQERIDELEQLLVDSTVRATMDGIVTSMTASVGDKLEGTSAPCVIADLSSIVVNIDVSELDIDRVAVGMPVTITMDMDESVMFFGTVSSVSMEATFDQSGQSSIASFPAVIELDPTDVTLTPDRSVSYRITSASSMDCVMVPSSAIVYTEQGAAVYAKSGEGQSFPNALPSPEGSTVPEEFVLVPVETGIYDETNTEILSGIDEDVEVYLAGPQDAYEMMGW